MNCSFGHSHHNGIGASRMIRQLGASHCLPMTDRRPSPEQSGKFRAASRLAPAVRCVLRHSAWDALFIALALAHGFALIEFPSIPLIALGFWWNANTIAHSFIH